MSDLSIRIAAVKDAEALLAIYRPYVENTAITFEYEVPSAGEFRGRIENTLKKYPYLVAEQDGRIVGYAYASAFKTRAAYDWSVELSVYVDMNCKRSGIGSALYAKLEEILARQNICNVNACIAYPKVEDETLTMDSILFHEKMGYTQVGMFHDSGYKFKRWYHMIWMEKMIGEHIEEQPSIILFPNL